MEFPTTTNNVGGSNMKPPEQSTFSTKNSFETIVVDQMERNLFNNHMELLWAWGIVR